ncbi:MAG: septum formation protein Maf [Anaerolineae bacterium]|nr:septum formation protein Maf [Anaerolineae bacterium]
MLPIPIILASGSPRRRELLTLAGVTGFAVQKADIDETPQPGEDPVAHVMRLSLAKAAAVARFAEDPRTVVIAADTIVVHGGEILGKPASPEDAARMLRRLRGAVHDVHTAVAVQQSIQYAVEATTTAVTMRAYTGDEIAAYVASGDPMDKAGAYAIQNPGFHPVAHLEGCYGNVVGLPLCTLARLLAQFDVAMPGLPDGCQDQSANGARCGLQNMVIPGA